MSLALLSKGEVEVGLRYAGYHVDEVYGGYDLSPWADDSPRAIFLARWPGIRPATTRPA